MGIFSRIKNGISSKANAALDKAIDPEKELEMAILELEEGRKKALQELVTYKATAKQLDNDIEKYRNKAAEWERRAMVAVKAGDDEAAKTALREKKLAEQELAKIERDKHEAASYAIQLNKSRKEFETKLTMLKLRKGTLATQIAAARSAGGDAFGNDSSVWDKFQRAEERIDAEAIETEVDAAMRGEDADAMMFDAKLNALPAAAAEGDDALAKLKEKMAVDKLAKQKALAAGADATKSDATKSDATKSDATKSGDAKSDAAKSDAAKSDAAKSDAAKPGDAKPGDAKATHAPKEDSKK
jgi:phage shock protein A